MKLPQRIAVLSTVVLLCIGLDQWTKIIAIAQLPPGVEHWYFGNTVRFVLAHNNGAFLSLFAWFPEGLRYGLLTIGVAVLLIGLVAYLLIGKDLDRIAVVSLALIFSGGASNLYDRFVNDGYVVDYVQIILIGWLRTGVFNVADMAIMAGAILLLFDLLRKRPKSSPSTTPT